MCSGCTYDTRGSWGRKIEEDNALGWSRIKTPFSREGIWSRARFSTWFFFIFCRVMWLFLSVQPCSFYPEDKTREVCRSLKANVFPIQYTYMFFCSTNILPLRSERARFLAAEVHQQDFFPKKLAFHGNVLMKFLRLPPSKRSWPSGVLDAGMWTQGWKAQWPKVWSQVFFGTQPVVWMIFVDPNWQKKHHQRIQVPKMEVLFLKKAVLGRKGSLTWAVSILLT